MTVHKFPHRQDKPKPLLDPLIWAVLKAVEADDRHFAEIFEEAGLHWRFKHQLCDGVSPQFRNLRAIVDVLGYELVLQRKEGADRAFLNGRAKG